MRKVEWGTPWFFRKVLVISVLNKHAENRAFAPNIPAVENKRVVLGEVCRNLSVPKVEVHPFRSAKVGVLPVIFLLPFAVFISLSFSFRPPPVFLPSSFGLVPVLLPSFFGLVLVLLPSSFGLVFVFLLSSFGLFLLLLPSSFGLVFAFVPPSFHLFLSFFPLLHALFFSFSPFPFPLGAYLRPPLCPRSAAPLSAPSPQAPLII